MVMGLVYSEEQTTLSLMVQVFYECQVIDIYPNGVSNSNSIAQISSLILCVREPW